MLVLGELSTVYKAVIPMFDISQKYMQNTSVTWFVYCFINHEVDLDFIVIKTCNYYFQNKYCI